MVATVEPSEFVAGDTVAWQRTFLDYPASSGWTLAYTLINATGKQSITASASGVDHFVTLTAATTATWPPGVYRWQAVVTKAAERYTVGTGEIVVRPNLVGASRYDPRSFAQRMVDACEAALLGHADQSQLDLITAAVGDRSVTSKRELLIIWRDKFKAEVRAATAAAGIAQGTGGGSRIQVRF